MFTNVPAIKIGFHEDFFVGVLLTAHKIRCYSQVHFQIDFQVHPYPIQ